MRLTRVLVAGAATTACTAGVAVAAHLQQVDPATVPTGALVAHSDVGVVPVSAVQKAVRRGAEVTVQHARLSPGQATPWHTHPGPVIVTVVSGTLVYEHAVSGTCRRDAYGAGSGFTDRGRGKVHRGLGGPEGVDFYAVYILPRGSASNLEPRDAPAPCAG